MIKAGVFMFGGRIRGIEYLVEVSANKVFFFG